MHFTEVEVRELFGRPLDIGIDDIPFGLTAVYGPNASGKTALAVAISRVMNSNVAVERSDRILARLIVDDVEHEVNILGPVKDPDWPQSARADLYRLGVNEVLLGPNKDDQSVLEQALTGGADLNNILPSSNQRPPSLYDAVDSWKRANRAAADAANAEERLAATRDSQKKAARDAEDLQAIDRRIQAKKDSQTQALIEQALEEMRLASPGIEKQTDDAVTRIKTSIELLRRAQDALQTSIDKLERFGGSCALRVLEANDNQAIERLKGELHSNVGELSSAKRERETAESDVHSKTQSFEECRDDRRAGSLRCSGVYRPHAPCHAGVVLRPPEVSGWRGIMNTTGCGAPTRSRATGPHGAPRTAAGPGRGICNLASYGLFLWPLGRFAIGRLCRT